MNESTRKKVIAGLLVVAIIWGYFNLRPSDKKAPAKANAPTPVVQQPKPQTPPAPVTPKLVDVEEKAQEPWGKDPFRVKRKVRRQTPTGPATNRWVLSGILYNILSPAAIINKQTVTVGDTIDNARVVRIDKKAVVLEHNGRTMTLTVTKG